VVEDCDGSALTTGDRTPLAGVSVALKQGTTTLATTTSDASGQWSFGYLETGVYDVTITPPSGGVSVDAIAGSGGNAQSRVNAGDVQVDLTNAQVSSANVFAVATTHASPVANAIAPNARNQGDAGFTLTVNGSGFLGCSVVRLDGADRPTTFVGGTQLTAAIPAGDVATPGTRTITVFTPAPGGGLSAGTPLTVNDTAAPVVTVTAPNGGESFVIGSGANITWNATDNVGVTLVDLLLSRTGSAGPFDPIATGVGNSGSYAWTVDGPPTTSGMVRVVAHDGAGLAGQDVSDTTFAITGTTGVSAALPKAVDLAAISPNPVTSSAIISYALPRAMRVSLAVVDLQGRVVAWLARGEMPAGMHEMSWSRGRVAAGLYFVRMEAGGRTFSRRMAVVK
jgi:hypothetical protein